MTKYAQYKVWWMDTQAPSRANRHLTSEDQFKDHINLMSTYEFFELLCNWGN